MLARSPYDLMLFDVEAPEQRGGALRDLARRDRVAGLLIMSLPISETHMASVEYSKALASLRSLALSSASACWRESVMVGFSSGAA